MGGNELSLKLGGALVLALMLHGCGGESSASADQQALQSDDEPAVDDGGGSGPVVGDGFQPPDSPQPNDDPDNNPGPEGDSGVAYNERHFPLNAALGDIWGTENDHYSVDFTLTNGNFMVESTEVDGQTYNLLVPVDATAIIYVELYSPGSSMSFTTFSHSPFGSGGGVLAGNAYFDNAYVGIDANNNGEVEPDEKILVIGGTFEFGGVLPDIQLSFSLSLDNGQMAEGHYTGLFDFTQR